MALKNLYSTIRTAVRFYFRHFYSVNKRLIQLVFRKNRVVMLHVKNYMEGNSVKRSGSTISLIISTENAYLISINGLLIPVLNKKYPINIHYPLNKGNNKLTVCARGIGNKQRFVIVVENDQPVILPFAFNKRLLVKEPNRILPAMTIRVKELAMQNTTIPAIKLKLPSIKRTAFILTQSLEEDLLNCLANYQKEHE